MSRDRNLYPNQAEYVTLLSESGPKINGIEAIDPICDSFPSLLFDNAGIAVTATFTGGVPKAPRLAASAFGSGFYQGLTIIDDTTGETVLVTGYDSNSQVATLDNPFSINWTTTDQYSFSDPSTDDTIFINNGINVDNFYTGKIMENITIGEFRTIVDYNGTTKMATLDSAFGAGWLIEQNYQLRTTMPFEQNVLSGSTISTFTLPITSNTNDGFYIGFYMFIPSTGDVRRITSYDADTQTGTIGPYFSVDPLAGTAYEILPFTRDSVMPLNYTGSAGANQNMTCHEITLVSLTLPNKALKTGGRIANYPYLFVAFGSETDSSSGNRNILYSNNPHASKALILATINDISNPTTTPFIKIDGNGATQRVKFKPNDSLRIRVYLSDGRLFEPVTEDNVSPLPPNPLLQITALIAIKKVSS